MNPFTTDHSQSIGNLGESQLIDYLRSWLGEAAPPSPFGMGDDCAVLASPTPGSQQLVTADPIIYGKHFDDSITPQQAAAKLLRRNLSDIAAMGGRPMHAVISLALDPQVSISWIKEFYTCLASEANHYGLPIIGGDVSSANSFIGAFLTLYGETIPHTPPLLRGTAKPGSPILVTGSLGGTRLQKHYSFTPRLAEGQWLAKSKQCLSCSDLSDGLGKDFANIMPSGLTCEIDCSKLPIANDAKMTADQSGHAPEYHVFNDGEDFELIFALKPETDLPDFISKWTASISTPVSCIGYAITPPSSDAPKLLLKNPPNNVAATGYEHLR